MRFVNPASSRNLAKMSPQPPRTDHENGLLVADHFAMLADELAGRKFSKAEHRRKLQARPARKESAIEWATCKILGRRNPAGGVRAESAWRRETRMRCADGDPSGNPARFPAQGAEGGPG